MRARICPPDAAQFEALAEKAWESIPAEFRAHARNLSIQVTDFPDDQTLAEMGCETPFDLLGLYRGVGIPFRSVSQPYEYPDQIWLYRQPILAYWCDTGEDLFHIIRHVLIHEIGHHFGFSDDDMHAIEAAAE